MSCNPGDPDGPLCTVSVKDLFQNVSLEQTPSFNKRFVESFWKAFKRPVVSKPHTMKTSSHSKELRKKEGVTLMPPVPETLLHKFNFWSKTLCSPISRKQDETEADETKETKIVINEKQIRDSISCYPDEQKGSVVFCYLPDLVLYYTPPMKVTGKPCPIKKSPWESMEIRYQKFIYPLEKLEGQFEEVPFRPWFLAMRLKELYRCFERSFSNAANRGKAKLLRGKRRTKKSYHKTVDLVSMKISTHQHSH
ncbi:hypothetical protein SEUBUCD646_0P02530 [Saccharomyces eubayanus]|uniref:Spore membrane assembly n=2 Tax=Saccharomyces TaxID=4930 RepID=A0A6C1EGG8_SACPS|nr:spore membrane assembly [Saccharomyces pastorianus]CAI1766351.1 hypothetical protein SEUBUCD650_0P02540 [Saccharomyces eubayanus]CAI1802512.1 hypothetical protein SEUBUCD646_0P02530 [Saccharomyces eubayanus]